MTWTRHGHHIPASPTDDEQGNRPPVARCGGTHLCTKCKEDYAVYLAKRKDPHVGEIKFDKPTTFRPTGQDVTAVQVTEDNAQEVAEWAGGEVRHESERVFGVVIPTLVAPEVVTVGNYVVKSGNRFSGARAEDFEPNHIHRPDLESLGQTSDDVAEPNTYMDIEDHIRRRAMERSESVDAPRPGLSYERSADSGPNGSYPPGYTPNKPRTGR